MNLPISNQCCSRVKSMCIFIVCLCLLSFPLKSQMLQKWSGGLKVSDLVQLIRCLDGRTPDSEGWFHLTLICFLISDILSYCYCCCCYTHTITLYLSCFLHIKYFSAFFTHQPNMTLPQASAQPLNFIHEISCLPHPKQPSPTACLLSYGCVSAGALFTFCGYELLVHPFPPSECKHLKKALFMSHSSM